MTNGETPPNEKNESGVIAAVVYAGGQKVGDIAIDDAGAWAKREGHVVWIGLMEPSHELLVRLSGQLGLHPLAVEDAEKAHQFPKLEQYGDSLFIAARTAQLQDGHIAFGETHLFVGRGFVVSVRHGASQSYTRVRERCEAHVKNFAEGEDFILYAILDFIVDNYFPVLQSMGQEVEEVEDGALETAYDSAQIERLYSLRRDLLRFRNAIVPMVDVCQRLERSDIVPIDPAMRPHFRDVTDHVRRVQEGIDTMREVLAFAFEASLMNAQMQQTFIARRLAAWAAMLAVPTAIAGVYGMNFENMPELKWRYGYYAAWGVIVLICGLLYRRLKKAGWL